jgi:hypothetical protein
MVESAEQWYVVQCADGHCDIVPSSSQNNQPPSPSADVSQVWGPFESHDEAIARRVGLIRSGKCKPI